MTRDQKEAIMANALSDAERSLIDAYWRAANYLSVGQIYLYDNPLLKEPLSKEHINRLLKKSPFACFEGGLITTVEADLAGERAVWGAFGGARAEGVIHLVIALPGEADPRRGGAAVDID